MASGLKYDFGICGECKYSIEEMVRDNPDGAPDLEATSILAHVKGKAAVLVVLPHRSTCIFHTNQREVSHEPEEKAEPSQSFRLQS